MKCSSNNFLMFLRSAITGGGGANKGFLKTAEGISLSTLKATAGVAALTDNSGGTASATLADVTEVQNAGSADRVPTENAIASLAAQINGIVNYLKGTADETNAVALKVEEAVDTVGHVVWKVPRDFDETAQCVVLRVLASMVTVSTDTDVELDLEVYHKVAGSALTADLDPTKPGTVLSATEQWIEFDLSTILGTTNGARDNVYFMEIITNGANDTDGEEVLIHDVELVYRSTLVSHDKEVTANTQDLR